MPKSATAESYGSCMLGFIRSGTNMFQSLFFFPLKTTRFHIDGRKIIRVLKMLKNHEMSDSEKKRKRGLIYQRLLDIVKVF